METILITGGTGMIGSALTTALLEKGYRVTILTREKNPKIQAKPNLHYAWWDIRKGEIEESGIQAADHIIHLAGAGIADKRWTKKRKEEIVSSRVGSSHLLVKAMTAVPNKIRTVVSASAIGWYGPDQLLRDSDGFDENDPPSGDFLGETCRQWEKSIEPVTALGKRLVKLRTGIVLAPGGGALQRFRQPLKFGVATILGSGRQVISWVQLDDLVNMYIAGIENPAMSGAYNAVAPHPITNKELVLQMARKHRRFFIPVRVPSFLLKAVVGEMATEVLKSVTVSSKKMEQAGFLFQFPGIDKAV